MTNQVHGLGSTCNVTKFLICHIASTVLIFDAITDGLHDVTCHPWHLSLSHYYLQLEASDLGR